MENKFCKNGGTVWPYALGKTLSTAANFKKLEVMVDDELEVTTAVERLSVVPSPAFRLLDHSNNVQNHSK